jgi:hypothetical protein
MVMTESSSFKTRLASLKPKVDIGTPLDNTCRIRSPGGFPACYLRRRLAAAKPDVAQRL